MTEVVVLGITIALLSTALLAIAIVAGFLAIRVRRLHEDVQYYRDATDKARLEYKGSYIQQGAAMQSLTREAVAAITTITHMMESVVKGTERGASDLSIDFTKLETRIESWMVTISQILGRLETKTNIFATNVSGGQTNLGRTNIHGNQEQKE